MVVTMVAVPLDTADADDEADTKSCFSNEDEDGGGTGGVG